MRLTDLLTDAAPDAVALERGDARLTWGELSARAAAVAGALRARGLEAGQRLAVLGRDPMASAALFWAGQWAGLEVVDLPAHVGAASIAAALAEARPGAVYVEAEPFARLAADDATGWLPPIRIGGEGVEGPTVADLAAEGAPAIAPAAADPDDVALVVYTSGTTGRPKGVRLSHANLVGNVDAANRRMGLTAQDSLLMVVPLYFVHGRMQLVLHARIGGRICFSEGFQFPNRVVDELEGYAVTGFSGVPYHFHTLLERSRLADVRLPRLRYALVTGGAFPKAAKRAWARAQPQAQLHSAYGATEASPRITHLAPEEARDRPSSAGRALPGVEIEILGSDGTPLPRGAIGEVVVSGPNVMRGYVSGDERAAGVIDDRGRLRTGDLGRLDADGYLFLEGRRSELIKTAGERVFPQEIEAVLCGHGDVRAAGVLGIPDPRLGERLVGLVVLEAGARVTAKDLARHCRQWLPYVRCPREIHVVDAIPQTASKKTDRRALREVLASVRSTG